MIYYILLTVEQLRCSLAPDGSYSRKALYSGFEIAQICELQIDLVHVNYLPSCSIFMLIVYTVNNLGVGRHR